VNEVGAGSVFLSAVLRRAPAFFAFAVAYPVGAWVADPFDGWAYLVVLVAILGVFAVATPQLFRLGVPEWPGTTTTGWQRLSTALWCVGWVAGLAVLMLSDLFAGTVIPVFFAAASVFFGLAVSRTYWLRQTGRSAPTCDTPSPVGRALAAHPLVGASITLSIVAIIVIVAPQGTGLGLSSWVAIVLAAMILVYGVVFAWLFSRPLTRSPARAVEASIGSLFFPVLMGLLLSLADRSHELLCLGAAVSAVLIVIVFANVASKPADERL
jgi:hypothetical protein